MKLSMWMIANRLDFLEPEIHIQDQAPQVLKSARLAYATDCVMVIQSGADVVCIHEDDTIRIKNISLYEGFELVQGIFDFYQEWMDDIESKLRTYDYQSVIDSCWMVFHNPLTLMNGQRKVLALSSQYLQVKMDEEWEHIKTFRHCSPGSVQEFQRGEIRTDNTHPQYLSGNAKTAYGCLTCPILFGRDYCGRISLLERDRPFNYGDRQLLQIVAQALRLPLAEQYEKSSENSNLDLFSLLLDNRPISEEALRSMLTYVGWKSEGNYQLALIRFTKAQNQTMYEVVSDTIRLSLVGCVVLMKQEGIIVIANKDVHSTEKFAEALELSLKDIEVTLSFSLPYHRILDTVHALKQADYAGAHAALPEETNGRNFFYLCAADYLLESVSLRESFHAVHPDIRVLWDMAKNQKDTKYQTFKAYLNNDRSLIRTASALFMHRNTLVYHLKKIHEIVKYDPEDTYTIDYMKLSIRLLDLWEKRQAGMK